MVVTVGHGVDDRTRSYELVAEIMDLQPAAPPECRTPVQQAD